MEEKYLPIGTVVVFKGCPRPLMIVGYMFDDIRLGKKDYIATLYPEGCLGKDTYTCFNHNEIAMVLVKGYKDKFFERLDEKLKEMGEANEDKGH